VCQCCGSSGVTELLLALDRTSPQPPILAFATVMADDICARATTNDDGTMCWSNVEHTAEDPVLPPAVGYLQGTAGVVGVLARFERHLRGDHRRITWPDDPF
jgi:hypothetical protein